MTTDDAPKKWVTPELIILARSQPEEAVLLTCKTDSVLVGPSTSSYCSKYTGAGCDNNWPS